MSADVNTDPDRVKNQAVILQVLMRNRGISCLVAFVRAWRVLSIRLLQGPEATNRHTVPRTVKDMIHACKSISPWGRMQVGRNESSISNRSRIEAESNRGRVRAQKPSRRILTRLDTKVSPCMLDSGGQYCEGVQVLSLPAVRNIGHQARQTLRPFAAAIAPVLVTLHLRGQGVRLCQGRGGLMHRRCSPVVVK